jgi:hypothetical protein
MKKTIQFLFAMSILMEGQNSFAGTNEITLTPDRPSINTQLASPARGIQYLIVTVMDDKEQPIAGATVSAPCTGQSAMQTNKLGIAQFTLSGSCNCNGSQADITTSSCETRITLSCSGSNDAVCQ